MLRTYWRVNNHLSSKRQFNQRKNYKTRLTIKINEFGPIFRVGDSNVKTTQLGRKERTFCLCTCHVTEHSNCDVQHSSLAVVDGLNPLTLSSCIMKHVCEFCEISNHMKSFKTSRIALKGIGEVVS